MLQITYKIYCTQDNEWKYTTLLENVAAPTTCPAHPAGHAVDTDTLTITAIIDETFISASDEQVRTANTFATIPGCSLTPTAGTWDVDFSFAVRTTDGTDPFGEVCLALDTTTIADSVRLVGSTTDAAALLGASATGTIAAAAHITTRVAVNGSQAINPRFRTVTSGAELRVKGRCLRITKVVV